MREHPILFSGPMVRAILDGRKTQTRRVMKPQPSACATEVFAWYAPGIHAKKAEEGCYTRGPGSVGLKFFARCPYGAPGDRLWVRETWNVALPNACEWPIEKQRECTIYHATHHDPQVCRWRPSIHMPRWASRITLEITDVRVERLQEISPEDAVAEGSYWATDKDDEGGFVNLWDSIHAARGHGWETNPWVWVISFTRAKDDENDGTERPRPGARCL